MSPAESETPTTPTSPDEIREDIAKHRAELAETVDLLSHKLNVKEQASEKVSPYKAQILGASAALVALLVLLRVRKARK